jgi:hypothetical protein
LQAADDEEAEKIQASIKIYNKNANVDEESTEIKSQLF